MAKNRFKGRERGQRWREGRYGKRNRRPGFKRLEKPRPVLEILAAAVVSLITAAIMLCVAVILLGAYKVPLHLGYGAFMGMAAIGCLIVGRRDRVALISTACSGLLGIVGTICFYAGRGEIQLRTHEHSVPTAAGTARP